MSDHHHHHHHHHHHDELKQVGTGVLVVAVLLNVLLTGVEAVVGMIAGSLGLRCTCLIPMS